MDADLCHSDRLADRLESQQREITDLTAKLAAETARADAAEENVTDYELSSRGF
jgi:hypothetical protein